MTEGLMFLWQLFGLTATNRWFIKVKVIHQDQGQWLDLTIRSCMQLLVCWTRPVPVQPVVSLYSTDTSCHRSGCDVLTQAIILTTNQPIGLSTLRCWALSRQQNLKFLTSFVWRIWGLNHYVTSCMPGECSCNHYTTLLLSIPLTCEPFCTDLRDIILWRLWCPAARELWQVWCGQDIVI